MTTKPRAKDRAEPRFKLSEIQSAIDRASKGCTGKTSAWEWLHYFCAELGLRVEYAAARKRGLRRIAPRRRP